MEGIYIYTFFSEIIRLGYFADSYFSQLPIFHFGNPPLPPQSYSYFGTLLHGVKSFGFQTEGHSKYCADIDVDRMNQMPNPFAN